jgi:MoaA/NifB/PqqE/SkfB family radical SAM enzyme
MTSDSLPQIFMVETTLACNLKCPECFTGAGKIRRNGKFMSLKDFRIIMEKIRPYVKYLYLYSWGEPMLNKDMIPMIRYASEISRTNISTNGLILTEETAEALITSGVGDIIVSMDGMTQNVYQKYRIGGDVSKAKHSLETLQHFNIKHGRKVNIIPQFIVFKHNQDEMQAFRDFCLSMELTPSFKAPYIRTRESGLAYSSYPQFIRPHFPDVASLRVAMTECLDPRQVFTILMDGSVVICCNDFGNETCFGNIFEKDVADIWHSDSYVTFRRDILTGHAPDFCINHCMSYFLESEEDIAAGFFNSGIASLSEQGEMLFMTGETQAAEEMFMKAVALDQDADAAHNNLAVIFWHKGDTDTAIRHFTAALAKNPNYKPAIINYANVLLSLGRRNDAKKFADNYSRNHPGDKEMMALTAELSQ